MKDLKAGRQRVILAAIVLACLLLQINHLTEPYGGFHSMNEAFFAQLGVSALDNPLSYPPKSFAGAVDFNIPPLLAYLLALSFGIFGVSEASARLVPIASSAVALVFTFLLGRRLYNASVGLTAAGILAVTPMFVLVGRNVQTDIVFTALMLASLYFYVESKTRKAEGTKYKILGGVLLGLSFLAKQPAVLALLGLAAWELLSARNFKWLDRKFIAFAAAALVVVSPYVLIMLFRYSGEFIDGQESRLAIVEARNSLTLVSWEWLWGFSPLIAAAGVLGAFFALRRRSAKEYFTLVFAALFTLFFVFYNRHSYYILPAAPFTALLGGRMLNAGLKGRVRAALIVLLVASGVFYSIMLLCGNKYGYTEYSKIGGMMDAGDSGDAVLVTSNTILGSYVTLIQYYNPGLRTVNLDKTPADGKGIVELPYDKPIYFMMYSGYIKPESQPPEARARLAKATIKSEKYALVLFGQVFYQAPKNMHFFSSGGLHTSGGLPASTFGVLKLAEIPALYAVKLRGDERVRMSMVGGETIYTIVMANETVRA